ncbi:MAG: hypothetical protein A4S09_01315 [Proteobacteria bacterium SG_bin7]|nr:MAG: hypothetical protein A4S09_01315 [Proteobacteria bacterium SG_bin7]
MNTLSKAAREWFASSNEDLRGATALHGLGSKEYLRLVPYLCQQAAEKALKGYLVFRKIKVVKTHDLRTLSDLILPLNPELDAILKEASQLTPFATQFRYPDAAKGEPTVEDSEFALRVAKQVFNKMVSLIPFDSSFKF